MVVGKPPAISAGSVEPPDHLHVEALLRLVPWVAFEPEVEPFVAGIDASAELSAAWPAEREDALGRALSQLGERSRAEANGGLAFLARTLEHFIRTEPVSPTDHPLMVALYERAALRGAGAAEDPDAVARRMNAW